MSLPGVYRARAVKLDGKALTAYIPQIFGDTSISIIDIAGDPPATFPAMGWVGFQSGLQEAPVWLGSQDVAIAAAVKALRTEVFYTRRLNAFWQYANVSTAPPGSGQMRTNPSPVTTMWLHKNDTDGYDRSIQLDFLVTRTALDPKAAQFSIRGTSGSVYTVRTNGKAVDSGVYYTIPISVISGTEADRGFRVEITMLSGIWAGDVPT